MLRSLFLIATGLRRLAAADRGVVQQLTRIADAVEAGGTRGVALRTYYRDDRPGAVEDAALFHQSDADFAELERREAARRHAGLPVDFETDLEETPEGEEWRDAS